MDVIDTLVVAIEKAMEATSVRTIVPSVKSPFFLGGSLFGNQDCKTHSLPSLRVTLSR